MHKIKKISLGVLWGAVSFTILYYAALISLPNIIDLNKYKDEFANQIEKQTGFKVSCENIEFKRTLTPCLKIHMYHTLVLYPDNQEFLKLKDSELKVKILPLILRKVVIKDAKFTRPIINMTLYKDFSTSFEKYLDTPENIKTNGFVLNGVITDTLCERYKLKIKDETTDKIFYLEGDELYLKNVKLNDSANFVLKGSLFEGEKEYLKYDLDVVAPLNARKEQFTLSPFKTIMESDIKGFVQGKIQTDKNNNVNGNLKIDDLSLKLDDVLLSNNSVNLLFKGKEAVIDAVLHTSNTDSAVVHGAFNYGNKKYIELTTKAKNVNLSNLYKIVSVISQSLNIPNQIKDLKVKGLLDADFSLSSDLKKLKSNGSAKIINARLSHVSLPYSAESINADVDLNNNKIVIKKAQALVNTTPISITGSINEDVSVLLKVSSENLNLKNLIKIFGIEKNIPVSVKKGQLSFNADINGHINKNLVVDADALITDLSFVDNKYNVPVSISLSKFNLNFDKNSYNGEILCENVKSLIEKTPVDFENLKLFFDKNKITIPNSTLKLVDSYLTLNGSVNEYLKKPVANFDFSGNIKASNIANIVKPFVNEPYKAQGFIKTQGKFSFADENANIKMQMFADENNYLSYLVIKELLNKPSVVSADVDINGSQLDISNISLVENQGNKNNVLTISGQLENKPETSFKNLKINIPSSLTASTNFLGGEEFSLNGNLILNGIINKPVITGDVKVFYYNLKKYLTAIKNADISFSKDNLRIIAPDVQINNSKLNLIADVVPVVGDSIIVNNMQLNSVNLDFNSLYSVIEKERNPFAKSLFTVKKGIATVNKLQILDLKAQDISSDFSLENNILKLENIDAKAYSGQIAGKINYDIPHSQIEVNLDGKNVAMKESLYDLCKFQDNISGTADFSSAISFIVGDYTNAIKSLNGKIDFHSINGKMGSLGKFEYYLSAQNILYHGLLNTTLNRIADVLTKDKTAHYRFADGSVLFQNGYMITSSIKTTGSDMSLYVTGRHNLLTNQVNIDIYGRISDEIRNKLGSFGDVSISDFLSSSNGKKANNILLVNKSVVDRIPNLYNQTEGKTNTFRVNIYGDINSINAINSFMWILPKEEILKQQQEKLPDFSDMTQEL